MTARDGMTQRQRGTGLNAAEKHNHTRLSVTENFAELVGRGRFTASPTSHWK